MARSASLKPRKKKVIRLVRRGVNRFALAPTDNWLKAKHFVHYEIESKEWGTRIKEYIKKNYSRDIVAAINRLPEWKTSNSSHWATTVLYLEISPELVPDDYSKGIVKWINTLAEEGRKIAKDKKEEEKKEVGPTVTPTIQDRIFEQSQAAAEDIDEWLDGFIENPSTFDPSSFDFKSHFAKNNVSQAHARKIKSFFERSLDDYKDLQSMPTIGQLKTMSEGEADLWQQLKEGYNHLKKADVQRYIDAVTNLYEALDYIIESSKAQRKPRIAKPKSADKQVTGVRYCKTDDKYKITSINPVEIIGATELWIFNIKTRKLGKYVAEDGQQFQVKGTTLLFYDVDASIQKTLRKPDESLKEFKTAGKVKLRKFLEDIPTTDTKLNGRFNSDTIILKVS